MDKIEAVMLVVSAIVGFVLGRVDRNAGREQRKRQDIKRRIKELNSGDGKRYRI